MDKHKLNRFSSGFTGTTAAEYQSWVHSVINNKRASLTRGDLLQAVTGLSSILDPSGAYTESYIPFASASGSLTENNNLQYVTGGSGQKGLQLNMSPYAIQYWSTFEAMSGNKSLYGQEVSLSDDAWNITGFNLVVPHIRNTFNVDTYDNAKTDARVVTASPSTKIASQSYAINDVNGRTIGGEFETRLNSLSPTRGTFNGVSVDYVFKSGIAATDSSVLTELFSLNGELGTVTMPRYGAGSKDATTLNKTQSVYLSGYATDGTLLEVEMGGSFADDATASSGSVPLGGIYYNTTNSVLQARLT